MKGRNKILGQSDIESGLIGVRANSVPRAAAQRDSLRLTRPSATPACLGLELAECLEVTLGFTPALFLT